MNSDLRKRLILFGGIGVAIIVVILLIVWIVSLFTGGRMSFQKVEETMKNAAIEYYEVNKQLLPVNGGEVTVDATTLATLDFMKPLEKIVPDGSSCTGNVVVKDNNGIYSYTPYLNCGTTYTTVELYKKIIDQGNIVTTGNGLYQMNGEYVFRGEEVNNYVKIGENLWQVTKVTKDNQIQLILYNSGFKSVWDDRYNVERNYNVGINDFNVSRIKDYLNQLYNNEVIFDSLIKEKMVPYNLCYEKRSETSNNNDGSIECSKTLTNQYVGLLPIYDYLNASLDDSCNSIDDRQCQNYNYLAKEMSNWWTITADTENTYWVYSVSTSGYVQSNQASNEMYVKPVIRLSSSVMYSSGSGTELDPYIIN